MDNQLIELIKQKPSKKFNLMFLSSNPNISFNYVSHPDELWDWGSLSCNPNINIDKLWVWRDVSRNPNLKMSFVLKNKEKQWTGFIYHKTPILRLMI